MPPWTNTVIAWNWVVPQWAGLPPGQAGAACASAGAEGMLSSTTTVARSTLLLSPRGRNEAEAVGDATSLPEAPRSS
jgi:hypothetical protein